MGAATRWGPSDLGVSRSGRRVVDLWDTCGDRLTTVNDTEEANGRAVGARGGDGDARCSRGLKLDGVKLDTSKLGAPSLFAVGRLRGERLPVDGSMLFGDTGSELHGRA